MPPQDCFRFDDDERLFPTIPGSRQENPEEAIELTELGPPTLAVQDGELLAKGKVLKCQLRAGFKRCWNRGKQAQDHRGHGSGVSGPEVGKVNDISRASILANDNRPDLTSGDHSGGSEQGCFNGFRHLNEDEPISWVQVVFAALINDPHIAVFVRLWIRQYAVDLVQLQRSCVPLILETDNKFGLRFLGFNHSCNSVEVSFPLEFLPANPVRFVPVDLGTHDARILQPDHCLALHLAPSSVSILFLQAGDFADMCSDCYGLDIRDLSQYIKVHRGLPCGAKSVWPNPSPEWHPRILPWGIAYGQVTQAARSLLRV